MPGGDERDEAWGVGGAGGELAHSGGTTPRAGAGQLPPVEPSPRGGLSAGASPMSKSASAGQLPPVEPSPRGGLSAGASPMSKNLERTVSNDTAQSAASGRRSVLRTSSWASVGNLFSLETVSTEEPEPRDTTWHDVLKSLQKEKKRAIARKEEHYVNRSLFCLDPSNPFRERMIRIAEWDKFNRFVLGLILLNCVFLVLDDPVCKCATLVCTQQEVYRQMMYWKNYSDCDSWPFLESVLNQSEVVFTILFTCECVIKIIARGFVWRRHAYLQDPWNWLDFAVVVTSVASLLLPLLPGDQDMGSVAVLRTVRVFRPLRTMTRIKGMKPLIDTLVKAFVLLMPVIFLLLFFLIVFGILGHELFSGKLHGRCYVNPDQDVNTFTAAAESRLLSQQIPFMATSTVSIGSWNAGEDVCGEDSDCDPVVIDGQPYEAVCSRMRWCYDHWCENDWNGNPYEQGGGLLSFDNLLQSLLIVYQTLTVEGWVDQLSIFQAADSITALPYLYFMFCVVFGTFFVLQLLLAVLSDSYMEAQGDLHFEKEREAMDVEAILKVQDLHQNMRRKPSMKRRIQNFFRWISGRKPKVAPSPMSSPLPRNGNGEELGAGTIFRKKKLDKAKKAQSFVAGQDSACLEAVLTGVDGAFGTMQRVCRPIIQAPAFDNLLLVAIILNAAVMGVYHHSQLYFEGDICKRRCDLDINLPANASQYCHGPIYNRTWDHDGTGSGYRPAQRAFCFLDQDHLVFPGEKAENFCSQHTTREACEAAPSKNGLGCYYFSKGAQQITDWIYSVSPGCKMGLYDSNSFASSVQFPSRRSSLGIRQVCGDDLSQCTSFPREAELLLEAANLMLTMIFVLEMILKMIGLGLPTYFDDNFNVFDCVIVCLSILEIILSATGADLGGGGLSALRGLRLFRLFKLARSWKDMRVILSSLGKALGSLFYCAILLIIFMYIFSLLAMSVFGGIQNFSGLRFTKTDAPRSNFDSFFPSDRGHGAFVVIFQIISGENWNVIMYNVMTNMPDEGGGFAGTQALNALVPMFVVFFGNYIIMNVFIAILLQGFLDKDEDEDEVDEESKSRAQTGQMGRIFGPLIDMVDKVRNSSAMKQHIVNGTQASHLETKKMVETLWRQCQALDHGGVLFSVSAARKRTGQGGEEEDEAGHLSQRNQAPITSAKHQIEMSVRGLVGVKVSFPEHTSLGIFTPLNQFRVWCAYITRHPWFDDFILLCILITTVTLVFVERPDDNYIAAQCGNPITPGGDDFVLDCSEFASPGQIENINCPRNKDDEMFGAKFPACGQPDEPACCAKRRQVHIMSYMDKVFSIIFLAEFSLKIVSDGLLFHPLAYLRDSWNILDFVIVVISMLTAWAEGEAAKMFKVLRAFRALRPLRAVKRNPSLKVAAICLLSSIPSMMNVLVVVLVWFAMYSMLGVQFYRGSFWRCENIQDQLFYGTAQEGVGHSALYVPTLPLSGPESVPSIMECVSQGQAGSGDSIVSNGIWQPKSYSFDNVLAGILILIETSTTEGWLDLMAMTTDAVQAGITPVPNWSPWTGTLFSAIHVFLGAFVLWNLIVAEVISNYMKIKCLNDGISPYLTQEQEDWQKTTRMMLHMKPRRRVESPKGEFRRKVFALLEWGKSTDKGSSYFDQVVTAVICINVGVMAADTHDQSKCTVAMFFWMNLVFTAFFVLEAAFKMVGLGFRWYFVNAWNTFDFVVVVASVFTMVLDYLAGDHDCGVVSPVQSPLLQQLSQLGILRAIRILRVLRLVQKNKEIRGLMGTLVESLPSLGSVAGLLILMMTIFAVLGVSLFYNVNPNQDIYGNVGDDPSIPENYQNWGNSMHMLLRMTTGEAWNYVMYYCMQADPYKACWKAYGPYLGDGCGSPLAGVLFHVCWQLLGTYVLMQLFTAIIIENFSSTTRSSIISKEQLDSFVDVWVELDPECFGCLPHMQLRDLIARIPPPIGLQGKSITSSMMMNVLKDLKIPIRNGHVHYYETFSACIKRVTALSGNEEEVDKIEEEKAAQRAADEARREIEGLKTPRVQTFGTPRSNRSKVAPASVQVDDMVYGRRATAAESFAAARMQHAYREWKETRIQVAKGTRMVFEIQLDGNSSSIVHR